MVSILSPGVYVFEKDESNYPVAISPATVGIVGFATKGPVNKATLITDGNNLVKTFGNPTASLPGQGLEGALEILETTDIMYFVRAATSDALEASAAVSIGACPAIAVSGNSYGVNNELTILAQVVDNNGVSAFPTAWKQFNLTKNMALTQQIALAKAIGTEGDDLKLFVQFPYTINEFGQNVPTSLFPASGDAGIIVGSFPGQNAKLMLSANAPIFNALDISGNLIGGLGTNNVTASGISLQTSSVKYLVKSLYPGTGYNIGTNDDGSIKGNSVEVKAVGGDNFTVTVNDAGASYETFKASFTNNNNLFFTNVINVSETSPTSEIIKAVPYYETSSFSAPTALANFWDPLPGMFGKTVVSGVQGGLAVDPLASPRFAKLIPATYSLSGGNDGTGDAASEKAALIGDASLREGMYALDDDILNISIALVPGYHDEAVQNALITLAEETTDFLAVVSPPAGLDTAQEAIDWSNGFSDLRTAAINSSYAAIYWPHVKTFVPTFGADITMDPAIYGARQMAYTASVSELWFAPAGFIRGRLTKPTDVEVRLSKGDRDSLYSGGNAINPIVNFPQQGITIFGQRTAQRTPTALDRINVRLLAIYIKKVLLRSVTSYLFEPNDPILWERIKETADGLLADIQNRRGITEYSVICDATTNTPVRVDRNELWCKVVIRPTKTAEAIVFELNLISQSGTIS